MKFGWETQKEKIVRGYKISPLKKMEALRLMNELADKVLTIRQKAKRRQLKKFH